MILNDMQFTIEIETQIQGNVQLQYIYIICLYLIGVHDTKILLIKTMMTIITLLVQFGIIQFQTTVDSNNHHDDPLYFRLV